jgi:hypothetical protein
MSALEIRRLKAFGHQVCGDAARDLQLLRDIQATLDYLDIELERARQQNQAAELFIQMVKDAPRELDPEGEIVKLFDSARDCVGEYHAHLVRCRQCAIEDPELRDDDGIVEAYTVLIDMIAALHNNLNALSWVIGEHDADLDSVAPGGPYTNADDLLAALGS